jgi:hypothetical protein
MTLPASISPVSGTLKLFTYHDVEGAVVDGQWLVRDVALGERLGLERPTNIRAIISKNREELESLGLVHVVRAPIVSGKGRVTEVTEYLLNQAQVLLIAMLGRTPASRALRAHMIAVYNAWHAEGMGMRIASPSFWEDERRRLAHARHRAIETMRASEPGLRAEEARLRSALEDIGRRRADAKAGIAAHERALRAMGEVGPMALAGFRRDLGAVSDRACVFHGLASGVDHDLSNHVARTFGRRLSKRELDDVLKALTAMDVIERQGEFGETVDAPDGVMTVSSFAEALTQACRTRVVTMACEGAGVIEIASAISIMRMEEEIVIEPWNHREVPSSIIAIEALIAAGCDGRLDDRTVLAWDLGRAIERRMAEDARLKAAAYVPSLTYRRPPPAPDDADVRLVDEDMTIGEAIERALSRSASGIARADLAAAASEAAGRGLKPISVLGQLPRLRDQGRIVQDGDRWRLPASDHSAMRPTEAVAS